MHRAFSPQPYPVFCRAPPVPPPPMPPVLPADAAPPVLLADAVPQRVRPPTPSSHAPNAATPPDAYAAIARPQRRHHRTLSPTAASQIVSAHLRQSVSCLLLIPSRRGYRPQPPRSSSPTTASRLDGRLADLAARQSARARPQRGELACLLAGRRSARACSTAACSCRSPVRSRSFHCCMPACRPVAGPLRSAAACLLADMYNYNGCSYYLLFVASAN